jgi:hypothetical protein
VLNLDRNLAKFWPHAEIPLPAPLSAVEICVNIDGRYNSHVQHGGICEGVRVWKGGRQRRRRKGHLSLASLSLSFSFFFFLFFFGAFHLFPP